MEPLYKEYLGVDVPDDKHGVLQDSHWSGGSIGYFPSYALGSAYGAQLLRKMKETVDVDECLKTGNFAPINAWNREHIWQYGCLKKPGALLEQALGEKFDLRSTRATLKKSTASSTVCKSMSIPKGDVRQDISFFVRKIQKVHCNSDKFSV